MKITKAVNLWSKKIGRKEAKKRLVARDVQAVTADKLCRGKYDSDPREWLAEILLEEMAKDGFTFAA